MRGDPRTYADLATPAGLAEIATYASGIGANKNLMIPRIADGFLGTPTTLVRDAHANGLIVHGWTFRAENAFLPADFRSSTDPAAFGDLAGEIEALPRARAWTASSPTSPTSACARATSSFPARDGEKNEPACRIAFRKRRDARPRRVRRGDQPVYGGGGNAGATFRNDFIEMFNRGTAPMALGGWSVQYASAAGTTWQVTPLPGHQPGRRASTSWCRRLRGRAAASACPRRTRAATIAMSATAGKVALVSNITPLSCGDSAACLADPDVRDLVGYGRARPTSKARPRRQT